MQAFIVHGVFTKSIKEVDGEVTDGSSLVRPIGWLRYWTGLSWRLVPPWKWSISKEQAESQMAALKQR